VADLQDVVDALKELTEEVRTRLTPVPKNWDSHKVEAFIETSNFVNVKSFRDGPEISWFSLYNNGTTTVYYNFQTKSKGETSNKIGFLKAKQTKTFPGSPPDINLKNSAATAADVYIEWWW
jgi:hypothetical protein